MTVQVEVEILRGQRCEDPTLVHKGNEAIFTSKKKKK